MKNQYVGDINNYRKYGLLRTLCNGETRLAVCWMLTRDDGSSDGKKLKYLSDMDPRSKLDSELFELLLGAVPHNRNVAWVEKAGFLKSTSFFTRFLPDDEVGRKEYFRNFLSYARGSEVVFFDPDNGLEVPSRPYGRSGSSKYLYWNELKDAWDAGHSVLVYQHFPREKRPDFITRIAKTLRSKLKVKNLVAFQTPHVAFFLMMQPTHNHLAIRVANVPPRWREEILVMETQK